MPKESEKVITNPLPIGVISDLSNVIEKSKIDLQAIKEPKNKGGRPIGWRKNPGPAVASQSIPSSTPVPGPAAPMIAEVYGTTAILIGGLCKRPNFRLEPEEQKTLGDQADILLQWYLPDLLKDPKRAALYTHLFTVMCVGIRMLKTPPIKKSVVGVDKAGNDNTISPKVDKPLEKKFEETKQSAPIAPTSNPAEYYNSLNGEI